MDIDLFSEIIKDLVFDYDEVAVPGLGVFVSEVVPSSFSDKGYTINPPYRKLSFRQRQTEGTRLVDSYSKVSGLDSERSEAVLSEFIQGLKQTLRSKKMVLFPGLGRLRATKENTFFFIPDEDLDIYSYGFGLEPVSLKTHEETPEEVSSAVAGLKAIVDVSGTQGRPLEDETAKGAGQETGQEPTAPDPTTPDPTDSESTTPAANSIPASSALEARQCLAKDDGAVGKRTMEESCLRPEDPSEEKEGSRIVGRNPSSSHPERKKRSFAARLALAAAIAVAAAALLLGSFMILGRFAPDLIDSVLYTQEELRIINS